MKNAILILTTIIILGSCSISSQVPKEEDLLTPRKQDLVIWGLEKNWVYVNHSDDSTNYKSMYWPHADTLKVGNCFIIDSDRLLYWEIN